MRATGFSDANLPLLFQFGYKSGNNSIQWLTCLLLSDNWATRDLPQGTLYPVVKVYDSFKASVEVVSRYPVIITPPALQAIES